MHTNKATSSSAAHIGDQKAESSPKKLHYDFLIALIILVETAPVCLHACVFRGVDALCVCPSTHC